MMGQGHKSLIFFDSLDEGLFTVADERLAVAVEEIFFDCWKVKGLTLTALLFAGGERAKLGIVRKCELYFHRSHMV
jgi:hypothetical protein